MSKSFIWLLIWLYIKCFSKQINIISIKPVKHCVWYRKQFDKHISADKNNLHIIYYAFSGEEVESDVIAPSSLEVCLALKTLIVILALWTLITVTIVAITTYSTVRYHNYNKVITGINSAKKASEGTSAVVNHKALSENAYANQIPSVNTPTTKQVKLVNVLKETKRAGDVPPTGDVVTLSNRTTYNTQLCTNTHALYPEFPKTNAVRRKSIEMRDIVKN